MLRVTYLQQENAVDLKVMVLITLSQEYGYKKFRKEKDEEEERKLKC